MRRKRIDWAQFLSLPALILFSIFFVYPLLKGIGMSLTDWDGMGQAEFVGLKNFANFFSDARYQNHIDFCDRQCSAIESGRVVLCFADEF